MLSFNTLENLFWLVTVGHVCAVWIGVKIMSLNQQNVENLEGFVNFPDALWCLSFSYSFISSSFLSISRLPVYNISLQFLCSLDLLKLRCH